MGIAVSSILQERKSSFNRCQAPRLQFHGRGSQFHVRGSQFHFRGSQLPAFHDRGSKIRHHWISRGGVASIYHKERLFYSRAIELLYLCDGGGSCRFLRNLLLPIRVTSGCLSVVAVRKKFEGGILNMSDEEGGDVSHGLAPFLRERLPALGLDYETYGAYVLPLLLADDGDDDNDDGEWDSVMELLQASSETHSDDDDAWVELRRDIEKAWSEHRQKVHEEEVAEALDQKLKLQEQIEQERLRVQDAALAKKQQVHQNKSDDAAKQALMARFGYEDPDGDAGGDGEDDGPVSNRDVARQMEAAKSQAMREHKGVTKRDEQKKTADAKKSKISLKEERRKRATKGERKR